MVAARSAAAHSRIAWAKVNLFLEVTGVRADGYHDLESLIVFAGLGDRLDFAPADELIVTSHGDFAAALPSGEDNLVVRAARVLAETAGVPAEAEIRLHKRLPVAAGLGGGSADAAAALEGLAKLWDLRLGPGDLARLAAGLGADVPVCLEGRPALVRGVGDLVERPPPLPAAWLVLANPGLALSTREVFEARDDGFSSPRRWRDLAVDAADLAECLSGYDNDLEEPARRLCPEIGRVLGALSETPGVLLARMSGSGATCFGLLATGEDAKAVAAGLTERHASWWVAAAPILHGKLSRPWR